MENIKENYRIKKRRKRPKKPIAIVCDINKNEWVKKSAIGRKQTHALYQLVFNY